MSPDQLEMFRLNVRTTQLQIRILMELFEKTGDYDFYISAGRHRARLRAYFA